MREWIGCSRAAKGRARRSAGVLLCLAGSRRQQRFDHCQHRQSNCGVDQETRTGAGWYPLDEVADLFFDRVTELRSSGLDEILRPAERRLASRLGALANGFRRRTGERPIADRSDPLRSNRKVEIRDRE
jgi:hypothetical protein